MSHPTLEKESLVLLQNVDCNCNDCIFMVRDVDKFKVAQARRREIMLEHFNAVNAKEIENLIDRETRRKEKDPAKLAQAIKAIEGRMFVYGAPHPQINYGNCTNPESGRDAINFLPTTFSGDTQQCFKNRRSIPIAR